MREVIGKSLANEVVLLQGAEGVLEDGILGAVTQAIEQLGEGVRFECSNAHQVGRGIEVKRLHLQMWNCSLRCISAIDCCYHCHRFTTLATLLSFTLCWTQVLSQSPRKSSSSSGGFSQY